MSQNLTTLLVPATIPQDGPIRQLLLLFNHVFLYAPTEDNVRQDLPYNRHDLCRHYAPVPFGKDLETFQQLLKDVGANRAEHYGGGLSSLSSRASMDIDESTVWELINRMRPKSSKHGPDTETLYQARLLLKLAELTDQEEEEINRDLTEIDKKNKNLLAQLQGIDLPVPTETHHSSSTNPIHRLKAWGHLFLADPEAEKHWIIAANSEIFEILSDHAGRLLSDTPEKLITLPVPDPSSLSNLPFESYIEERNLFRNKLSSLLKGLTTLLQSIANTPSPPNTETVRIFLNSWTENICGLAGGSPQGHVDIYRLNIPLGGLFTKVTKGNTPSQINCPPYTIVAVTR